MGCQIHSLNPQFLYKRINTRSKELCKFFSFQPNFEVLRTNLFSPYNNLNDQQLVSTATLKKTQIPETDVYNVKFKTLGSCKLGISRYPDFEYNAEGGRGSGTATEILDGEVSVDFDVQELYIPPLSSATTKFLGLPLPPFLKIDIVPQAFLGKIHQESGKVDKTFYIENASIWQGHVCDLEVDLKFRAKFCFSIGRVYKAPPLLVETVLTSEESKGKIRGGRGERLNTDGTCRLVGVATVDPINDVFLDTFLSLPTECLANLNAIISFSSNA